MAGGFRPSLLLCFQKSDVVPETVVLSEQLVERPGLGVRFLYPQQQTVAVLKIRSHFLQLYQQTRVPLAKLLNNLVSFVNGGL